MGPQQSARGLGLLLTFEDALDVILRKLRQNAHRPVFDDQLVNFLISFPDGHVGCLSAMLEIIGEASIPVHCFFWPLACRSSFACVAWACSLTVSQKYADHLRRNCNISFNAFRSYLSDPATVVNDLTRNKFSRGLLIEELNNPFYYAILKTTVASVKLRTSPVTRARTLFSFPSDSQ
jgi:hypothetical protein